MGSHYRGRCDFFKTDNDTPWKKSLLGLYVTSAGEKIVSAKDSVPIGNYKSWTWSNQSFKGNVAIDAHFKDNSPKGLNVYVMEDEDFENFRNGKNFSSYNCISRVNALQYDCNAKVSYNGGRIYFVISNAPESFSDAMGLSQPASFEFDVHLATLSSSNN